MAANTAAEPAEVKNTALVDPRLSFSTDCQLSLDKPRTASKDQHDSEDDADYLEAKHYWEVELFETKSDLAKTDESEFEAVDTNSAPAGSDGESPTSAVNSDWHSEEAAGHSQGSPSEIIIVDEENWAELAAQYPEIENDDEDSPFSVDIVGSVDWAKFAAECGSFETGGESQESQESPSAVTTVDSIKGAELAAENGNHSYESAHGFVGNPRLFPTVNEATTGPTSSQSGYSEYSLTTPNFRKGLFATADTAGEDLQPSGQNFHAARYQKWCRERDAFTSKMIKAAAKDTEDQMINAQARQLAPANGGNTMAPKSPSFFIPHRPAPAIPHLGFAAMSSAQAGSRSDAEGNQVAPAQKKAFSVPPQDAGINIPSAATPEKRSSMKIKQGDQYSFLEEERKLRLSRRYVGTGIVFAGEVTAEAENTNAMKLHYYAKDRQWYGADEEEFAAVLQSRRVGGLSTSLLGDIRVIDPRELSLTGLIYDQNIGAGALADSAPSLLVHNTEGAAKVIYIVHQLRRSPITPKSNTNGISPCDPTTVGVYSDLYAANNRASLEYLAIADGHLTGSEHDKFAKMAHQAEMLKRLYTMGEQGETFDQGVGFEDGTIWRFWVEQSEVDGPGM